MEEIIYCDSIKYGKIGNQWYVWNGNELNHNPDYPWCYCWVKYNKVFSNQKNIQRKLKLERLLK